jgi:hypothetical protein
MEGLWLGMTGVVDGWVLLFEEEEEVWGARSMCGFWGSGVPQDLESIMGESEEVCMTSFTPLYTRCFIISCMERSRAFGTFVPPYMVSITQIQRYARQS